MQQQAQTVARPLRVALYARYSSENQRDASIEDQVRICRARAEREGWVVVECFTDFALSGSSLQRPGYQALLIALRAGHIDLILSESLDRLSRDQEHVAGLHKAALFAGVRIVTLAEGDISELHIGLKGTMGALYLKDLADKTRRGLEGRVRAGRSGGGLCYGYRVVRGPVGRNGEAERGLREIEPAEAAVVRRIFEAFAGGQGPKSIAAALNREGIAGPRGGIWQAGTLRGQAARDTGILRNRLYVGELVWNQRRWLKDPATGRRVAQQNNEGAVVTEPVPELRIIAQPLWERVQARLDAQRAVVERNATTGSARPRFWEQKRPTHLLSGRLFCGGCGATFQNVGRDYLACRVAQAAGPCDNRARVRRGPLETRILEALSSELMRPDLVAEFVAEFTREWNRLSAERTGDAAGKRRELGLVERKIAGLIDAIADGLRTTGLRERLEGLERRQAELAREVAEAASSTPALRLHPNIAELYRAQLARLREANAKSASPEVREALRALIAGVEVHPPIEGFKEPRVELIGHLAALLRLGAPHAESPSALANEGLVLGSSLKVDAGTGFEPVTFRL